jgi:hypothetical protein
MTYVSGSAGYDVRKSQFEMGKYETADFSFGAFEDCARQSERSIRTAGNGETSTLSYANKFFRPVLLPS